MLKLEEDFKPITDSIDDIYKLKKNKNKQDNVCKTVLGTIGMMINELYLQAKAKS